MRDYVLPAVLLGLGYRQPGRGDGHFDASVGAKLDWPPEPYVKGTYRLALLFLERNLLRLQETIFWREDEHLGATTRADLERLLADDFSCGGPARVPLRRKPRACVDTRA